MTEKLFWQDSYRTEFDATILNQFAVPDGHALILDRTCFYATSGGQPNDLGTLQGVPVQDVRIEGEQFLHVVSSSFEASSVHGVLDWPRRFDHMQQHSGQHILSASFFRLFQAETSSFHLGEEYCSIELDKPDLKESQIREAEDLANQVILSATPVDSFFVDPARAKEYPLRKQSDLTEALRLIQFGNFDLSPCSGTHVKNTGEIGMVFVHGFEKMPQTLKILFLCGNRVRTQYNKDVAVLKKLSKSLTTSFELLPESVDKLQSQVKTLRRECNQLIEDQLKNEALELAKTGFPVILVGSRPYSEWRVLAQNLSKSAGALGAFASSMDHRVVFFKNPAVTTDLKAIFQNFQTTTSAKGGGASHFIEAGGLQVNAEVEALLRQLLI